MFLRPAPFDDEPCALLRAVAQSLARVCCPALPLATTLAGRPSLLRVPRWRDETVRHVWRPCLKRLVGRGSWSAMVLAIQHRIDAGQDHKILASAKAQSDF